MAQMDSSRMTCKTCAKEAECEDKEKFPGFCAGWGGSGAKPIEPPDPLLTDPDAEISEPVAVDDEQTFQRAVCFGGVERVMGFLKTRSMGAKFLIVDLSGE